LDGKETDGPTILFLAPWLTHRSTAKPESRTKDEEKNQTFVVRNHVMPGMDNHLRREKATEQTQNQSAQWEFWFANE
jgi:hypothetical protein